MSYQLKEDIISWGHPSAKYTDGDGPIFAEINITPKKFTKFCEILLVKCSGDKCCVSGSLKYQDDDGDWVPIDSQDEYDEALKYLLRANKPVPLLVQANVDERKTSRVKYFSSDNSKFPTKDIERHLQKKLQKEASKFGADKNVRYVAAAVNVIKEGSHMKYTDKLKHKTSSSPPVWFEKYMQKFKSEILTEIEGMILKQAQSNTANPIVASTTETVPPQAINLGRFVIQPKSLHSVLEYLPIVDHKSQKLLKKIKSHNSEKKLKKLNSKLEQLELKRARLIEWNRKRHEHGPTHVAVSTPPYVMNASVLDSLTESGSMTDRLHVSHNSFFTKKWKVLNTGTAPWTDQTELRRAWLTPGLKPVESKIQCPCLKPGEEGEIDIKFQAPDFAGVFESYWHFYHNNERFGPWMGCSVIVDPKPGESVDKISLSSNLKSVDAKEAEMKPCDAAFQGMSSAGEEGVAGTVEEDRGEYDSDAEEENNVSHSDIENQSTSDSDDSDNSESFVHVPMPPCYQYQVLPLYDPQLNQECAVEKNEDNATVKLKTPPTTPREPDSEEEEELFVEATGTENHAEATPAKTLDIENHTEIFSRKSTTNQQTTSTNTSEKTASTSKKEEGTKPITPPIHILPEKLVSGIENIANIANIHAQSATEAIMKSFLGISAMSFNIPPQAAVPKPPEPADSQPSSNSTSATGSIQTPSINISVSSANSSMPTNISIPPINVPMPTNIPVHPLNVPMPPIPMPPIPTPPIPNPFIQTPPITNPSIPTPPIPNPSTVHPTSTAIPLPPPPARPSFVSSDSPYLTRLREMGFNNTPLNMTLLAYHSNNLSEVVAELLSTPPQRE